MECKRKIKLYTSPLHLISQYLKTRPAFEDKDYFMTIEAMLVNFLVACYLKNFFSVSLLVKKLLLQEFIM